MKIFKIDRQHPDPSAIQEAAQVLRDGGLVVYPTDTAYGLGANALDETAVRKMYELKGRDFSKPTHVVVRDWKMIESLAETTDVARKLYNSFLPGPLTIILRKKPVVPKILTAGLPTIGVRIPDSPITQALSKAVDFPYTTPSANLSGGPTPYSPQEAIAQLGDFVDLVLDVGKLPKIKPSTIIDLTSFPKILREGPVKRADIEKVLGLTIAES